MFLDAFQEMGEEKKRAEQIHSKGKSWGQHVGIGEGGKPGRGMEAPCFPQT